MLNAVKLMALLLILFVFLAHSLLVWEAQVSGLFVLCIDIFYRICSLLMGFSVAKKEICVYF